MTKHRTYKRDLKCNRRRSCPEESGAGSLTIWEGCTLKGEEEKMRSFSEVKREEGGHLRSSVLVPGQTLLVLVTLQTKRGKTHGPHARTAPEARRNPLHVRWTFQARRATAYDAFTGQQLLCI